MSNTLLIDSLNSFIYSYQYIILIIILFACCLLVVGLVIRLYQIIRIKDKIIKILIKDFNIIRKENLYLKSKIKGYY